MNPHTEMTQEEFNIFSLLCKGLRLGIRRSALSSLIEANAEVLDRAYSAADYLEYVERNPDEGQHRESHLRIREEERKQGKRHLS